MLDCAAGTVNYPPPGRPTRRQRSAIACSYCRRRKVHGIRISYLIAEISSSEWITGQLQRVYCASKGDGGTLPGRGSIPTRGKEHEGQAFPRRVEKTK